jgi:MSHA pilin protein MshD
MGTGQMMITMGALMLLALVVLRVNNGFFNTTSVLLDSKLGVLATSVATSVIEEATGKAFDHKTDSTSVNSLSNLTSSLGPESGETHSNFNDVDDYDGYSAIDTTMPAAEFSVDCVVDYVKDTNLDGKTSSRTWHKKITVFVSSPSMLGEDDVPDTISMSAVYSYWYFR